MPKIPRVGRQQPLAGAQVSNQRVNPNAGQGLFRAQKQQTKALQGLGAQVANEFQQFNKITAQADMGDFKRGINDDRMSFEEDAVSRGLSPEQTTVEWEKVSPSIRDKHMANMRNDTGRSIAKESYKEFDSATSLNLRRNAVVRMDKDNKAKMQISANEDALGLVKAKASFADNPDDISQRVLDQQEIAFSLKNGSISNTWGEAYGQASKKSAESQALDTWARERIELDPHGAEASFDSYPWSEEQGASKAKYSAMARNESSRLSNKVVLDYKDNLDSIGNDVTRLATLQQKIKKDPSLTQRDRQTLRGLVKRQTPKTVDADYGTWANRVNFISPEWTEAKFNDALNMIADSNLSTVSKSRFTTLAKRNFEPPKNSTDKGLNRFFTKSVTSMYNSGLWGDVEKNDDKDIKEGKGLFKDKASAMKAEAMRRDFETEFEDRLDKGEFKTEKDVLDWVNTKTSSDRRKQAMRTSLTKMGRDTAKKVNKGPSGKVFGGEDFKKIGSVKMSDESWWEGVAETALNIILD